MISGLIQTTAGGQFFLSVGRVALASVLSGSKHTGPLVFGLNISVRPVLVCREISQLCVCDAAAFTARLQISVMQIVLIDGLRIGSKSGNSYWQFRAFI